MSVEPRYPTLYQINTRVWLQRLSREHGKRVTLADVDPSFIDDLAQQGVDWVWLLSVWRIGPAGRTVSRNVQAWRAEFNAALPDLVEEDICGSGFAIAGYSVSEELGGNDALADFRAKLAVRGIRLMLDFVPNHTAIDHPWTSTHPEYYVQGDPDLPTRDPQNYMQVETVQGVRVIAHGRDPNFPGWPDTLQLNYANADLRRAMIDELIGIAEKCDGVRCDMAMLLLPDVFHRTWGITPAPFWPSATSTVRQAYPAFRFMAEVYWDLEWALQQDGFDYCYDKRLYDRLRTESAAAIRQHLNAGLDYQDKLCRFLENHDEPSAAATFPLAKHRAAAMIAFLSPAMRFFQQGEFEGARIRVPTHLCRGPIESVDANIDAFYRKFLSLLRDAVSFRNGLWAQVQPLPAWPGNGSSEGFVAFTWANPAGLTHIVVVNYAPTQGQCYLVLPFPELRSRTLRLTDVMGDEVYERDGSALTERGFYIDHGPWHFNVFEVNAIE